jgi:SAM-dependent methyltransferase
MSIKKILQRIIPEPIKSILRPIRNRFIKKYDSELSFWRSRFQIDKGKFQNSHYERMMLAMAEQADHEFVRNKIVADFGCGPRGSLFWADSALVRIGIDVLADRYADEFADDISSHQMTYVKSSEKVIPLPSDFVDVMFTLNAIDHVDNFSAMCNEIIRVLKPGGEFIGSFNLEEPPGPGEPQQLNEKVIADNLLGKLEVVSYRVTRMGPEGNRYAPFFDGTLSYRRGEEGILWAMAKSQLASLKPECGRPRVADTRISAAAIARLAYFSQPQAGA